MIKKTIIISLLATFLIFYPRPLEAEESTLVSPTPKPTVAEIESSEVATDEAIQEIRDKIKQKVEEKLQVILEKQEKRGWPGIIIGTDSLSLTLKTRWGEKKVSFDEETIIVNDKRKTLGLTDLKTGQKIIAMGYLKTQEELEAKRIVVTNAEEKTLPQTMIGVVADKSEEANIVAFADFANEKNIQLKFDKSTKITQLVSGKVKKVTLEEIKSKQKLVAVYEKNGEKDEQTFLVKAVHILTPPEEKTPSATPAEEQE